MPCADVACVEASTRKGRHVEAKWARVAPRRLEDERGRCVVKAVILVPPRYDAVKRQRSSIRPPNG